MKFLNRSATYLLTLFFCQELQAHVIQENVPHRLQGNSKIKHTNMDPSKEQGIIRQNLKLTNRMPQVKRERLNPSSDTKPLRLAVTKRKGKSPSNHYYKKRKPNWKLEDIQQPLLKSSIQTPKHNVMPIKDEFYFEDLNNVLNKTDNTTQIKKPINKSEAEEKQIKANFIMDEILKPIQMNEIKNTTKKSPKVLKLDLTLLEKDENGILPNYEIEKNKSTKLFQNVMHPYDNDTNVVNENLLVTDKTDKDMPRIKLSALNKSVNETKTNSVSPISNVCLVTLLEKDENGILPNYEIEKKISTKLFQDVMHPYDNDTNVVNENLLVTDKTDKDMPRIKLSALNKSVNETKTNSVSPISNVCLDLPTSNNNTHSIEDKETHNKIQLNSIFTNTDDNHKSNGILSVIYIKQHNYTEIIKTYNDKNNYLPPNEIDFNYPRFNDQHHNLKLTQNTANEDDCTSDYTYVHPSYEYPYLDKVNTNNSEIKTKAAHEKSKSNSEDNDLFTTSLKSWFDTEVTIDVDKPSIEMPPACFKEAATKDMANYLQPTYNNRGVYNHFKPTEYYNNHIAYHPSPIKHNRIDHKDISPALSSCSYYPSYVYPTYKYTPYSY